MCKMESGRVQSSFLAKFIRSFDVELSTVNPGDVKPKGGLLLRRNEPQSCDVKPSEFMRQPISEKCTQSTFPQLSFPQTLCNERRDHSHTSQAVKRQVVRESALHSLSRPILFSSHEIDLVSERIAHNVASTLLILVKANIRRAIKYQCLKQTRSGSNTLDMCQAAVSCLGQQAKSRKAPLITLASVAAKFFPSSHIEVEGFKENISSTQEQIFSVPLKFSVEVEAEINEVRVGNTISSIGILEGRLLENKIQNVDLKLNVEEFLMSMRSAATKITSVLPISQSATLPRGPEQSASCASGSSPHATVSSTIDTQIKNALKEGNTIIISPTPPESTYQYLLPAKYSPEKLELEPRREPDIWAHDPVLDKKRNSKKSVNLPPKKRLCV